MRQIVSVILLVLLGTGYTQEPSAAELQSQLDAAQAQLALLESQLAQERHTHENRLAVAQESLSQLRVQYVQDLRVREHNIADLQRQFESQSAQGLAEVEVELESLRNTIAELASQNRDLSMRLDDETIRTNVLRQNLAAETAKLRELSAQTPATSELETLQATITELESQNRDLSMRLDDETIRTNVLRQNLAAETAKLRELSTQPTVAADVSELNDRIAQLTAENLILQEQLGVLNARVDELTAALVTQNVELEVSAGRAYTVQSGDSLSSIAFSVYNDASRWVDIAQANDIPLGTANVLEVGQVLVLPELDSE